MNNLEKILPEQVNFDGYFWVEGQWTRAASNPEDFEHIYYLGNISGYDIFCAYEFCSKEPMIYKGTFNKCVKKFSEIPVGTKFVVLPQTFDSIVYTKTEKGIEFLGMCEWATFEKDGVIEVARFLENSEVLVKILESPGELK